MSIGRASEGVMIKSSGTLLLRSPRALPRGASENNRSRCGLGRARRVHAIPPRHPRLAHTLHIPLVIGQHLLPPVMTADAEVGEAPHEGHEAPDQTGGERV